jgi:hypothetical protein
MSKMVMSKSLKLIIDEQEKKFFQIKSELEKLKDKDYKNYVKAIISIEKNIENREILDYIFEKFIINKKINLLNNEFNIEQETDLDLKIQEFSKLKIKIGEKELDHLYSDSYELTEYFIQEIEDLKKQLNNLINSEEN